NMRCRYSLSALLLSLVGTCAAEPAQDYPLWDGHESVADYAKHNNLEPTKTLDLGKGVNLELVLIPPGQFIMGTSEPDKPTITVFSGQVLIGIGGAFVLALLAWLVLHKRPGRRFSYSLGWLLLFCLASSV